MQISLGLILGPFCGDLEGWVGRSSVHTGKPESATHPDPTGWEHTPHIPQDKAAVPSDPQDSTSQMPPSEGVSASFRSPGQGCVPFHSLGQGSGPSCLYGRAVSPSFSSGQDLLSGPLSISVDLGLSSVLSMDTVCL